MKNTTKISQRASFAAMFLCTYALVLLWTPIISGAEALPETGKLIPPETMLLVDIGNFSQLRTQFEKTNYYKLYKDPAMTAFVEDFKTKFREKIRQIDNELVRTIVDTKIWPQGRVAIALVLNEQTKDANEPPVLFISQWGQSIDKIKEAVDKMVQKAIENGARRKNEDYRGVSVTTIIQNSSSAISYCFMDDCLAGAMNLDILKFVIAHSKGASSPALAGDADYIATVKAAGPNHDIDFYVNIKRIIETAIAEDTTGQAKTTMANLGLDNVTSVGLSIGISREANSSFCGKAFVKVDGAKRGICRMLDVESAAIGAPQFVPASAYSVVFLNLNIKKTYDELYNVLYAFSPPMAALMQTPLVPPSPQGEPGVQLKGDVIDHLGSQIIIAQSINKQFSGAAMQTPAETLVAVAVTNRSALEKSLSLFHSKIIARDKPDAKRELLGHTIYILEIPSLLSVFGQREPTPMQARLTSGGQAAGTPIAGPVVPAPKMAFTITDTHFVFGTESAVEQTIRTLSSPQSGTLSSAAWFGKAKSAIPSSVGLAVLQDNVASTEFFWKLMREMGISANKGPDASMGASPFSQLMFSGPGFDLFNFGLLPEFDTVRKYFGLSASYGISRQDGFFFEFKDINIGGSSN